MNDATSSPVRHQHTGHRGLFFIDVNGSRLARMTYTVAGNRATIEHTEVDEAMRGQRAGARLVEAAVQWARESNMKLVPVCSYAKSVFDKTPSYADVLAG